MANELEFYGDPSKDSGLTVTARVYNSSGVQVGGDISCTELGVLAIYQGDMPTAVAGTYGVRFFDGTTLLGQGFINWDGSAEVTDTTINTAIAGIGGGTAPTEADIYSYFTASNRQDTFKSDVTGLSTFDPAIDTVANVTTVAVTTSNTDMRGTDGAVTSVTAYDDTILIGKVDVIDANVDDIKAKTDTLVNTDLTGIATATNVTVSQNAIIAQVDANETKIDTLTTNVGNLNNISSADVTAAVPTTAEIEAALINEGDGQQLIDAIVQAIGNTNLDQVAVVAAIRADLERSGGMLDVLPILSEIEASPVLARASDISGLNDITASDVVTAMQAVANDFKADVSTLATQTIVNSILADTNELQVNQGDWSTATGFNTITPDNASITAILANTNALSNYDDTALVSKVDIIDANVDDVKAKTDTLVNTDLTGIALTSDITALNNISVADVRTELSTELGRIDTAISTRLATNGYTAPDNSSIAEILTDTSNLQSNQSNWLTVDKSDLALEATSQNIVKNTNLIPATV